MSRLFYHVTQDASGNILTDVSGTMRLAGTGTLATIYGDEALTVILPNPMTNHPSFGSFKCYLGASVAGYDFYLSKSGYTFETLTGVQGLGTMATQNAAGVAITGGTITGLSTLGVTGDCNLLGRLGVGRTVDASHALIVSGGTQLQGTMGIGVTAPGDKQLAILFNKINASGLGVQQTGNDTGTGQPLLFSNVAGSNIGSITTTATVTAYNTTSDARIKHDVDDLTGELDVVRALRPVRFRWNADDSPGVGFLAHEVQAHVAGVITGEADAMDGEGRIVPQMIDYAKLVPFLAGAVKTLAAQVEALTARLVVLEDALGI